MYMCVCPKIHKKHISFITRFLLSIEKLQTCTIGIHLHVYLGLVAFFGSNGTEDGRSDKLSCRVHRPACPRLH